VPSLHDEEQMNRGILCYELLVGTIAMLVIATSAHAQLPFFPGAEGFGGTFVGTAPAAGWFSNATVYHVTNLDDSGPGSFRGAFQENTANRIIVFDVGGVIQLTSDSLDIKNIQNYYIAGQTAPSPVTVYGDTTQITHSNNKQHFNTILRYMTFRKGTGEGEDAITFSGGGANGIATNMILDHVSGSWSEDEILSVTNYNTNVTVQYSMINDALVNGHAYGSLMRPKTDANVSFHHNLYANNASRQARFGSYDAETLTADFRNNVVYNFRDRASYAGGSSEDEQEYADVNYVGNYIIAGLGTTGTANIAFSVDKNVTARVYQSGNFIDPNRNAVLDGSDTGWNMFRVSTPVTDQSLTQMATPFATAPVTTQSATDAYHQIVDYVGNFWWARDAIDTRVIGNLTNFTGVPIGAAAPIASELNALLATPLTTHPVGYDTDYDGMPDAWEALHGGNLAWNADFDNDGYINLIEFVNEKGEFPAPAPLVFNGAQNNRYASIMNWKTDDGGTTAGSNWQPSKYDLAVIKNGTVVVDAVGQHAGTLQIAPAATNAAILNITGGWLNAAEGVAVGSAVGNGKLFIASGATLFSPVVAVGPLGELSGAGEIVGNVLNDGRVAPGTLIVSGNFAQNPTAVLKMEIVSAMSYDQLMIGGALMAGGTLDIDLLSYSPIAGDSFNLFDFSSSLGAFTLDLPALAAGFNWDATNLLTTGELAVVATAIAENADFNSDGKVDGRDFLIWQRGFGGEASQATGDANADGHVDANDLAIWQNQFGTMPELTAANVTVPEPSSLLLVATTFILTCLLRKSVV
jgi:hypothetical protein